jgi:uroporphyrinogen-III decarboxylase
MLRALEPGGIPDRVPATVHQWQPYHLNKYLGGVSDLEAFARFGLDAAVTAVPIRLPDTPRWKQGFEDAGEAAGRTRLTRRWIETPGGTLTWLCESDDTTTWVKKYPIRRKEDIELFAKFCPTPALDVRAVREARDALGDRGILRGFIWGDQGGPWQHACCLYDIQALILACFDDPAWVHSFMRILTDIKLRFIEKYMKDAPYDLVETGGGAGSSTCVSPAIFEEFLLPYDQELHQALHDQGHKVVYHTCGGMMPILELIIANGCDASETLTPPEIGGDTRPVELKERMGGEVALIGGIDQHTMLTTGTPAEIRAHVRETFEAYGPGGGYTMCPSDHFFETPPENLAAYAEAARECRY